MWKSQTPLSLFLSDVGPEFVIEVTVEHATKEYSALQYYWVRGCSLATHAADGAGATSSPIIVQHREIRITLRFFIKTVEIEFEATAADDSATERQLVPLV